MAHPTLARHLLSIDDYHRMIKAGILTEQDQVELIRGEIVYMSPKGSRHASCIRKIVSWLPRLVGSQLQLQVQDPIRIPEWSEPEPDIALTKPRADFYVDEHPGPEDILLLIEVADTSLAIDRNMKAPVYAEAGIAEYWIINLPEQLIEVYRTPQGGRYKEMRIFEPGEMIRIPGLGAETPVADWLI